MPTLPGSPIDRVGFTVSFPRTVFGKRDLACSALTELSFNLVLRALVVLSRVLLHPLLVLTTRDDKVVIFTVTPPRAGRHIADFYKLPIGNDLSMLWQPRATAER